MNASRNILNVRSNRLHDIVGNVGTSDDIPFPFQGTKVIRQEVLSMKLLEQLDHKVRVAGRFAMNHLGQRSRNLESLQVVDVTMYSL